MLMKSYISGGKIGLQVYNNDNDNDNDNDDVILLFIINCIIWFSK